jgi:cysteine desulfurase/selenocysteine lyase
MIRSVSFSEILFADPPEKFESGTPHIAGALGLKKSLEYIDNLGLENIHAYEQFLYSYAKDKLSHFSQIKIQGTAPNKVSLISFMIEGIHPHDVSSIFDREGVAIRAGHLCAEPLMKRLKTPALSRASFAFYNTTTEVDRFIISLERVLEVFKI